MSNQRLQKELKILAKDFADMPGCSAGPIDENLRHWEGIIIGPDGTPYAGGIFKLDIKFPDDYPYKAPKIKFATPIYHCNVNSAGNICLDILKDKWSPVLTVSKVILSICSLLSDPNPEDPLDPDVANLFKMDRNRHDEIAMEYTQRYAV